MKYHTIPHGKILQSTKPCSVCVCVCARAQAHQHECIMSDLSASNTTRLVPLMDERQEKTKHTSLTSMNDTTS